MTTTPLSTTVVITWAVFSIGIKFGSLIEHRLCHPLPTMTLTALSLRKCPLTGHGFGDRTPCRVMAGVRISELNELNAPDRIQFLKEKLLKLKHLINLFYFSFLKGRYQNFLR